MNSGVERAIVVLSLVPAVWALVLVIRNRGIDLALLVAAAIIEVAVLVQLVVGLAQLGHAVAGVSKITFVGYLVGAVLVPPAGVAWGVGEKSRYGSTVMLVVFLVLPVMVLRLDQIWAGPVV